MTRKRGSNPDDAPNPSPLRSGQWVRVASIQAVGRIVQVDARRNQARVQVGNQEWTVPLDNLAPTDAPPPRAEPEPVRVAQRSPVEHVIDLHGMTVEAALAAVDRAIDRAIVARLTSLRIVHGHGTGALRTAVRQRVKNHPLVASFRFGQPYEGGLACTVVELVGSSLSR